MANCCYNIITFEEGDELEKLKLDIQSALDNNESRFFDSIINHAGEDELDCQLNYGTNSDVGLSNIQKQLEHTNTISFNTKRTPCNTAIETIGELYNINFHMEFDEPGCGFAGIVNRENGEIYREDMSSRDYLFRYGDNETVICEMDSWSGSDKELKTKEDFINFFKGENVPSEFIDIWIKQSGL